MPVADAYKIYAANIGGTVIGGVKDHQVSPNIRNAEEFSDGNPYATFTAMLQQEPRIRFTTTAIAAALAETGVLGYPITSGQTAIFYFQKMVEGGTRAGTLSHFRMTVNEGLLLPISLQARGDGLATLTYELICGWDGTNNPIVFLDSQTLGGTPATDEGFVVGKANINSSDVEAVQGLDVQFGINPAIEFGDGDPWPSFMAIDSQAPRVGLELRNAIALNTYGIGGGALSASAIVYLRKLAQGGARVANATAQHVSLTVAEGKIDVDNAGGSTSDRVTSRLMITPTYDGSNAVLAVNTATAIS